MEKFNEEKIKKMLQEQQSEEQHGVIGEQDQQLYRLLFHALETLEEKKEERSIAHAVMQEVAELEMKKDTERNWWMFVAVLAVVFVATGLTYYFVLPQDLLQLLVFLKAHIVTILFVLGMLGFVQFADQKWVSKKLY